MIFIIEQRPRLGIEKTKALSLTDEVGLHPALTALKNYMMMEVWEL